MDDIKVRSIELSDFLKNASTEGAILKIRNYLDEVKSLDEQKFVDFPDGLMWFGVTSPLTRSDLKGKIVVLDFFTYCCMNCIHILPHLKALEEKHKSKHALAVIGVHSPKFENEKNVFNLHNAIVKLDISHPVVNDPGSILWNELDIACWPTILILDPNGMPIFTLVGEGHHEILNLFVEISLKYYSSELNTNPLPLCHTRQPVAASLLSFPGQVTVGPKGFLAVTDSGHHRVLVLSQFGEIKDVFGGPCAGFQDGSWQDARFRDPQGLVFHGEHKLFVADTGNHAVRLLDLRTRTVVTVVGTGEQGSDLEGGELGPHQPVCSPWGLCMVPKPPVVTSPTKNVLPPVISQSSGMPGPPPPPPPMMVPPKAPSLPPPAPPPPCLPAVQNVNEDSTLNVLMITMSGSHQIWAYFLEDTVWWKGRVYKKGTCAAIVGSGLEENRNNRYPRTASLAQPSGVCYSPSLKSLFIADSESSSIRRVCMLSGAVSPVVGGHLAPDNLFSYGDKDGIGTLAQLQHPLDVAWDPVNKSLLLVDSYNHKLKKVDVDSKQCTTISLSQELHEPSGVCVDGDVFIIADTNAHRLLSVQRNDLVVKELEIRQITTSHCGKSKIRIVWETTVPVSTAGSDVTLTVLLGPSFSGRWRVAADCPASIITTQRSGSVEAGRLEIKLFTNAPDEAAFEIDLAECRGEACHMGYYRLLARPVISAHHPRISTVSFTPDIHR